MNRIWEITGTELERLQRALEGPGVHTLRAAVDGDDVKFKINEGMWTPGVEATSPAMNSFQVEVIHSRDPDSECGIQIWVDGERMPDAQVYVADLDPGSSGPALSEWDEQTDEIGRDERLTPGFREAVVEERDAFRESSWITDDRPECPVCREPVDDGECIGENPHRIYNPGERFAVVDANLSGDAAVLRGFTDEQEAARFIETLPDHETGRYGLDDMLLGGIESGSLRTRRLDDSQSGSQS